MFVWIRKLIEKILYIEDDPKDPYYKNRRWLWWPVIGHWKGRIYFGVEKQLIQYNDKIQKPKPLQDFHIQLVYNPMKWEFGQKHMYYDGPHCFYMFGPFAIYTSLLWCLKCMPDDA